MIPSLRPLVALLVACVLTVGCGVAPIAHPAKVAAPVGPTGHGSGRVRGGQQPIVGSAVYLYAVSTMNGGTATSLLKGTGFVLTGLDGSFSISGDYDCPAGAYVYLLAKGGNPGVGVDNADIALGAGLGLCSSLTASTYIELNEVTTVAMAYSLSAYATSETQIGTTANLSPAFANIATLVEPTAGMALASNQMTATPQAKLDSLANSVAACINSTGIGAPCSTLFSAAGVAGTGGMVADTFQAVLNIAKDPTANVSEIYGLKTANAPFQPALTAAPSDWTIAPAVDFGGAIAQDANTYVFATTDGDIYVELRPDVAPKNVANFLYYVNNGLYNQSFFHRAEAGFVAQGGGYVFTSGNVDAINTAAPVVNEATLSNLRGTLSMALTGTDPNSATDQFFFNVEDNTSLDAPSADLSSGGYTVIGQIVGVQGYLGVNGGYSVSLADMDMIGSTPTYDLGTPFFQIPLLNYTDGEAVGSSNLIYSNISQVTTPANTVAPPIILPTSNGSSFSPSQLFTITDSTPGAAIYYYIFSSPGGGANPNADATLYTGPITLPATTYIVTYATATGYTNQSLYNYEYYTIQ